MITIEQIDEFRKRTNSSYEDAKYYLEKNNGDILEAIIDFERSKAGKHHHNHQYKKQQDDFGRKFADILQKGFDTRVVVEDKNTTLFTIPVILLILLIPMWPLLLLSFLFLMMLGYKFSIRDVKSQNVNVSSFFQNINEKMKEAGTPHKAEPNKGPMNKTQVPVPSNMNPPAAPTAPGVPEQPKPFDEGTNEEGYNEFTIE